MVLTLDQHQSKGSGNIPGPLCYRNWDKIQLEGWSARNQTLPTSFYAHRST